MTDETETFLNKRPAQEAGGFMNFVWNKKEKKFLGRTGMSWLEITIFYIIFYACLAAFWAVSLAIFVLTLDDELPRWYGKGSIIGINPGVGYQPWISDQPESTLIYINQNVDDQESKEHYIKYVKALEAYLEKYDDTNNTRVCAGEESNADDTDQACRFIPSALFGPCTKANNYGYPNQPCVLLSLNRLIEWVPVSYPDDSAPADLGDRYKHGSVAFACRGENAPDVQHLGNVEYFPTYGMDGKFFPYRVMPNYHQPVAMVQFTDISHNVVVQVECLAYAYNIVHDAIERMGLTHFEILIDDQK